MQHGKLALGKPAGSSTLLILFRVLMARLEQEASVDLLEEREKLVPLDLLDPLDSLDLL